MSACGSLWRVLSVTSRSSTGHLALPRVFQVSGFRVRPGQWVLWCWWHSWWRVTALFMYSQEKNISFWAEQEWGCKPKHYIYQRAVLGGVASNFLVLQPRSRDHEVATNTPRWGNCRKHHCLHRGLFALTFWLVEMWMCSNTHRNCSPVTTSRRGVSPSSALQTPLRN